METKKRKKTDRMVEKIKKALKVLEIVLKVGILALGVYAVVNRLQDINGISFFFTTWN